MSERCRYCCKSLKRRSGQFLAKERTERESPINTASNPLRESPVSLARGDLSPHIIIQSPRLRGGEFESHLQKRLLQQYRSKSRHQAVNDRCPLFPQQRTFVDQAAPTASVASLTGFAITGVVSSGTGVSRCYSRLHRHRRPRPDRAAERPGRPAHASAVSPPFNTVEM